MEILFSILSIFALCSLFIYNNKIILLLNIIQLFSSVIYIFLTRGGSIGFYLPWLILFFCFLIISISFYYLSFIEYSRSQHHLWFDVLLALVAAYGLFFIIPDMALSIPQTLNNVSFKIDIMNMLVILFSIFVMLFCSILLLKNVERKNEGQ